MAIVAGIGVAQATGLLSAPRVTGTSLTEVVVVTLLLTVAGAVTLLVVRALQESTAERRLAEAARLGFSRCLVPKARLKAGDYAGIELVPVGSVREAMAAGLARSRKNL